MRLKANFSMIQVIIRVLRSCYVYDIKTSNMLPKFRDCIFVGERERERELVSKFNERFNSKAGFRIGVSTGTSHVCARVTLILLRVSVSRGWLDLSSGTTQLPSLWRVKIARPLFSHPSTPAGFSTWNHEARSITPVALARSGAPRFAFFTIKRESKPYHFSRSMADGFL